MLAAMVLAGMQNRDGHVDLKRGDSLGDPLWEKEELMRRAATKLSMPAGKLGYLLTTQ